MERPQIRQTEQQHVESEREIVGSEAEELLRKYGYSEEFTTRANPTKEESNPITFEEMVKQEEAKKKALRDRRNQKMNGPKPITFRGDEYDSKVTYGSDEESGLGFKIEITSDMKLPKY